MLRIDWRVPGAYGHAKAIPPSGFAWEYLRRHEDYHRDFQTIARVKEPAANDLETFSAAMGCGDSIDSETPPAGNPCSGPDRHREPLTVSGAAP